MWIKPLKMGKVCQANQPTDFRAKYQRPLNRTQRTVLLKFRQNSLIKTLRFGCRLTKALSFYSPSSQNWASSLQTQDGVQPKKKTLNSFEI